MGGRLMKVCYYCKKVIWPWQTRTILGGGTLRAHRLCRDMHCLNESRTALKVFELNQNPPDKITTSREYIDIVVDVPTLGELLGKLRCLDKFVCISEADRYGLPSLCEDDFVHGDVDGSVYGYFMVQRTVNSDSITETWLRFIDND